MKEKIAKLLESEDTNDYYIGKLLFLGLFKDEVIKRQKKDYWGKFSIIAVSEVEWLLSCKFTKMGAGLIYLADDLENI